jgi:hypothetical protein
VDPLGHQLKGDPDLQDQSVQKLPISSVKIYVECEPGKIQLIKLIILDHSGKENEEHGF